MMADVVRWLPPVVAVLAAAAAVIAARRARRYRIEAQRLARWTELLATTRRGEWEE